jgi:hypothetical protein
MKLGHVVGIVVAGTAVATAMNVNEVNKTMAATLATVGLSSAGVVALDAAIRNKKDEEN